MGEDEHSEYEVMPIISRAASYLANIRPASRSRDSPGATALPVAMGRPVRLLAQRFRQLVPLHGLQYGSGCDQVSVRLWAIRQGRRGSQRLWGPIRQYDIWRHPLCGPSGILPRPYVHWQAQLADLYHWLWLPIHRRVAALGLRAYG